MLIKEDRCSEAFACGTAAIITPIRSIHQEDGEEFKLKSEFGIISRGLRESLLGIQEQTIEDPFNWIVKI